MEEFIKNRLREGINEIDGMSSQDKAAGGNAIEQSLKLPIAQFVDKFAGIASDEKVQAVLKSGLKDGDDNDDIIQYSEGNMSVKGLIPTQNEIGLEESLKNILIDKFGSLTGFLKGQADVGGPIVVYNGKHIIDGHHRWSQVFVANPNAKIPAINLSGDMSAEDVLKISHLSVAAGVGKLPLSSAEGANLLKTDIKSIIEYIFKNLDKKGMSVWASNGIKGKKAIAKHLAKNIKSLQGIGHMKGAPSRTKMPQTDNGQKTADVISRLGKGVVNFNNPTKFPSGNDGNDGNDGEQEQKQNQNKEI